MTTHIVSFLYINRTMEVQQLSLWNWWRKAYGKFVYLLIYRIELFIINLIIIQINFIALALKHQFFFGWCAVDCNCLLSLFVYVSEWVYIYSNIVILLLLPLRLLFDCYFNIAFFRVRYALWFSSSWAREQKKKCISAIGMVLYKSCAMAKNDPVTVLTSEATHTLANNKKLRWNCWWTRGTCTHHSFLTWYIVF